MAIALRWLLTCNVLRVHIVTCAMMRCPDAYMRYAAVSRARLLMRCAWRRSDAAVRLC
jgi:hypothetical protein